MEGLCQLKRESLELKLTSDGKQYYKLNYNESTKKSQGDDYNEMNDQPILLEQQGKRKCPVNSLKLYLSKLNTSIEAFFQKPNQNYKYPKDTWYFATPVGENTIGQFLKKNSENAGLTTTYTNHCIRGMTATAMYKSGYSLHDIAQVTKHKNIESLKFYLQQPTIDDMESYSNSLFKYADKENSNSNNNNNEPSDDEFEAPPVKTRNIYDEVKHGKKKESEPTTPQQNNKAIVPFSPQYEENSNASSDVFPPVTTSNVMQMYRQNPVGMFVGANLTNCTININLRK